MVLIEVEQRSWASLFKEAFGILFRIIKWSVLVFFLIFLLPDPWQLAGFPLIAIFGCLIIVLMRATVPGPYIYKVTLEGDILHFDTVRRGKQKRFSLQKDNFIIKYYRDPKHYPVFTFEQRKPYKGIYWQYAIGQWKHQNAMDFLEPYCRIIKNN